MLNLSRVTTARLVLTSPSEADLDELHQLHADPAVWEHHPSLRHTDAAQTAALLRRVQARWAAEGLGSWVARRPVPHGRGELVGLGGCSLREGVAWNLGYRLVRQHWDRGYAQELIAAARTAAQQVGPDLPVTAFLLEHNTGSRRAAQRAGLQLVRRGVDVGNPDASAVRLVYADRAVEEATLVVLVDHA